MLTYWAQGFMYMALRIVVGSIPLNGWGIVNHGTQKLYSIQVCWNIPLSSIAFFTRTGLKRNM